MIKSCLVVLSHAHCVKDAPKFEVDDDSEVCDFIDQYIPYEIPEEEGKLKELVLLLQQHKHSSYCKLKRHSTCRFNFPRPPSCKTLITQSDVGPDVASKAQSVLVKVLADGHTDLNREQTVAQLRTLKLSSLD